MSSVNLTSWLETLDKELLEKLNNKHDESEQTQNTKEEKDE